MVTTQTIKAAVPNYIPINDKHENATQINIVKFFWTAWAQLHVFVVSPFTTPPLSSKKCFYNF